MMRYRKGDGERSSLFTRRALLLGGAQAVLLSALAGRLYQLQVIETQRFATLAEENRINLRLLPPSRGLILDRTGQPLAGVEPLLLLGEGAVMVRLHPPEPHYRSDNDQLPYGHDGADYQPAHASGASG